MRYFRNHFTERHGNYYKIYSMSLWKLILLDAFLSAMMVAINFSMNVRKLPRLIITPNGVHFDRRQSPRYHYIPERRLGNILINFLSDLWHPEP